MSGCNHLNTLPDDTPNGPTFSEDDTPKAAPNIIVDCDTPPVVTGGGGDEAVDSTSPSIALLPREFLADFNTETWFGNNIDLTVRPDAVSSTYLISYSYGPKNVGDSSAGTIDRAWRAKVSGNNIILARANDANTAWEDDVILFSFEATGGTPTEIDLAFEQSARPVVALAINGHIWIYWFDPLLSDFTLDDLGVGRTPRVLLDDPLNTSNSDILLFYVNGTKISWVQQRDRYAIVYDTPLTVDDNTYIEELIRTTDNRVALIYSIHNTTTGRYSLQRLESTLYPIYTDPDAMSLSQQIRVGSSLDLPVIVTTLDIEALDLIQAIQSGTLTVVIINHVLFDIDSMDLSQQVQSTSTLLVVVIDHVLFDIDALDVTQQIQTGSTLIAIVIDHVLFDIDALDLSQQIQSGTLA